MLAATAVAALAGCGPENTAARPVDPTSVTPTPTSTPTSTPTQTPTSPTGESPRPPASATPSAPLSVDPSGVVVPEPGVTRVPAGQVDAGALPEYYDHRGEVWVFDDGYALAMFAAASSGCTGAEAVVVDQSATEVAVTLRPLTSRPGGRPGGGACTAVITPRPVSVTLREPLGDRTVRIAVGR